MAHRAIASDDAVRRGAALGADDRTSARHRSRVAARTARPQTSARAARAAGGGRSTAKAAGIRAVDARLLDDVAAAVVGVDLDGLVCVWNQAAEALFGWPAAEVIGRVLPIVPDAL